MPIKRVLIRSFAILVFLNSFYCLAGPQWTSNPFNHQLFIENKGQFDGKIPGNEKVYYAAQLGSVMAYFTSNGIVYRYAELVPEKNDNDKDKDEDGSFTYVMHYLHGNWLQANATTTIEAKDKLNHYYTYPKGTNSTYKADIYSKITYKNIYPGIDIEYSFIQGKDGIKYSVIVQPGADLSKVKFSYSGIDKLKLNSKGDVIFNTEMGQFTEHAPASYYDGNTGKVSSSYKINGTTESFIVGSYDKTKTLIIDPWVTDPMFANRDRAYDLDWDYKGNVYAFGGDPVNSPIEFVKLDNLGNIVWTYNADTIRSDYGDFATDKATGTSYLIQGLGGKVAKVNSNGMLVSLYPGSPNLKELWRAEFDQCRRQIYLAGGGTFIDNQAGILDTSMTAITPIDIFNPPGVQYDMALFTLDPDRNSCYMACVRPNDPDSVNFNNAVAKVSLPTMSSTLWTAPDGFRFHEGTSVSYVGTANVFGVRFCFTMGMNGAAASPDWLYLYDGDTLKQFNKNNGSIISRHGVRNNSSFEYGGLDVDACNNILLGVADSIYVIDSSFAITSKIPMQDSVYDIHFGQNNLVYACGKGYVTEMVNPIVNPLHSSAAPDTCSACKGTATINPCGAGILFYRWSNGATTQTATGLCAGSYTVTITDSTLCPPTTDTAVVTVTNNGSATITACCNDTINSGDTVHLTTSGATSYTWTPSASLSCNNCANPIASPTVTTTYTVATPAGSCQASAQVTIYVRNEPVPCGNIFVPNAFSPNGDNINDFLYVYGNCIISLDFKIYDRWGNQVFETNDPAKGWDGKYNGQPLNSGVYDYTIIAIQSNGITTDQKGSITLVR
jgi:gliding motility-associated-like protein